MKYSWTQSQTPLLHTINCLSQWVWLRRIFIYVFDQTAFQLTFVCPNLSSSLWCVSSLTHVCHPGVGCNVDTRCHWCWIPAEYHSINTTHQDHPQCSDREPTSCFNYTIPHLEHHIRLLIKLAVDAGLVQGSKINYFNLGSENRQCRHSNIYE